jgi:hypothetical protein
MVQGDLRLRNEPKRKKIGTTKLGHEEGTGGEKLSAWEAWWGGSNFRDGCT